MIVITVARKPLSEANVATNVLRHGCGAVHVDVCRISSSGSTHGRWPANLVFQHFGGCREKGTTWDCMPGCPVDDLDAQSGDISSQTTRTDPTRKIGKSSGVTVDFVSTKVTRKEYLSQEGGASRFFKQVGGKR